MSMETKIGSGISQKIEEKRRKPVGEAEAEELESREIPSDAQSLREEVERLKKIIEYGKVGPDRDTSPYAVVQIGDAAEINLVEERKKALDREDVDRIREIDRKLDALREESAKPGRPQRPRRTPISTRNPLKFGQRPGYRRHVVNDTKDGARIKMFLDAGWRMVEGETTSADGEAGRASQIGTPVRRSVGAGVYAFLMEIPEELYMRDQKLKWDKLDALEKGMINESADKVEGRYGSITINR